MYQLMIVNQENNVVGVCTNSDRLPTVEEVYPNKDYIGVEIPFNQDIANRYYEFYYDGEAIVEKPFINYTISNNQITTLQTANITITNPLPPTPVTVLGDGFEIGIESNGLIEYSNANVGIHQIILKANNFKDTVIEIEVV